MKGIEGRISLITGAARGIGYSIAEKLSEEGAHTVLTDISERVYSSFEELHRSFPKNSGYAKLMDVTKRSEVDKVVDEVIGKFGKIDFLVNNAGILMQARFMDYTEKVFDQLMEVNVKGVFHCCQSALRYMIDKKYGCIVNISSQSGKSGDPGANVYAATKAAVMRLTQGMSLEMAEHNIRVNCVCPGPIDTDMFDKVLKERSRVLGITPDEMRKRFDDAIPLKGKRSPQKVANVVVFMLSDESEFMTGQAINVTGGMVWW